MQQYFSGDGIQVVQHVDEVQIDFDSSRYRVSEKGALRVAKKLIKEGRKLDWNFDLINSGHIKSYFSTCTLGPTRANEGAMEMVDYIHRCAIAGP